MRLKFAPGVRPTKEQALEIAEVVMDEPDMGRRPTEFDTVAEKEGWGTETTWIEVHDCDHGEYTVRINLARALITILSIQ